MQGNQAPNNTYNIPQNTSGTSFNPVPSTAAKPTTFSTTQPPRRGIPKAAIFAVMALLLVIIIIFAFKTLSSSSGTKTANGKLTWWGLWEDPSVVQPLIDEYQSQHQGIKITYTRQSPQDYRERLTSSLAKGTGPDLFAFHNSWVPMFKGSLDALPANVMNPADFAKTYYPVASSDLTSGSSILGIPLEYDGLILYINQDIFDKAGKSAPLTWDDFRALAKTLTVKDDQGVITQAGAAMGRTENVDHWQEILALLMLQNNVDLNKPQGSLAENALTFFTLFSTADGVWDASQPSSTQAFAAGKLAMYIGPSWRAFDIITMNPDLKFKTYPMPQLPKLPGDNPNAPDITYATYWVQGVWSGSVNKTIAWDFLKFLSTQDSLTKLYQNETKIRNFGEPYPRSDMASLLTNHPLAGSVIAQAPGAKSWFLDSRTFDGSTGINTLMSKYFEDAVNAVNTGTAPDKALSTAADGVSQVLAQYKLIVK